MFFRLGARGMMRRACTAALSCQAKTADASQISPLTPVVLHHSSRYSVLPWLLVRVHPATTVRWTAIETAAYTRSHQASNIFQYSRRPYSQETLEQRARCERELCSNRRMEERRPALRSPRDIQMLISGGVAGERRLVQAHLRRIV